MAELAKGQGDSGGQNEVPISMQPGAPTGNRLENFVNNGETMLLNLAKTVETLVKSKPDDTLKTLVSSIKTLEEEVKDLKRGPSSDESSLARKKPRTEETTTSGPDSDPGTSNVQASNEQAGPSSLDDIDDFLEEREEEEDKEEQEADLLDDLDQYFVPKSETGEKISDKLATVVNRILREDPSEEKFKELKEKYKRPSNVDNMQVPTIDNTLWRVLDRQTRAVDLQLQRDMGSLTTCMVPVLQILDSLQNPTGNQKEDLKKIKGLAGDTFKLMSHFIVANIQQRKEKIKREKHLKPRVKAILKETTSSSTQLFGDKLKDEMKVLSEKAVSLTTDSGTDKTGYRSAQQSFLSRRGGRQQTQTYQRRYHASPYSQHFRDQGKTYSKSNQQNQQSYKKGPGAKNHQKRN